LLRSDQDYSVDRQRWRARRAEAREELRRARADLGLIELSIQRLADVRDMRPLLLVLGAFALVGVVQPLAMLALRPVPGSALARGWVVVVVSFTAALAVLLVFLWRESEHVTSDGDGDDD
jgi:hypothetical protein